LAVATIFNQHGYDLVLHCSSEASGAGLRNAFPNHTVLVANLANPEQVKTLCDKIKEFPSIDILVNNAGTFLPGAIHQEAEGTFEHLMAVNLTAPYHITRAALSAMIPASQGHIINICSTASLVGYTNGGSYCISKFGLLGLTRVLREELKPHGIKVTAILPGATYTDSWKSSGLPEDRFISAQDLAELIYTTCTLSPHAVVEDLVVRPLLGDIGDA
jgi:short-subunit dehydrogenase